MNQITATKERDDWRSNQKILAGLRRRYSGLHPLFFQRTVERATSAGDVFDQLEVLPAYPLVWDYAAKAWATASDLWLEPEDETE